MKVYKYIRFIYGSSLTGWAKTGSIKGVRMEPGTSLQPEPGTCFIFSVFLRVTSVKLRGYFFPMTAS
jgi:hypothetical protein